MSANLQLPERNCGFVNRSDVLRAATERVLAAPEGNRTIVIGGAPGCGKTATGIELAHRLQGYFTDGLLFARFAADPLNSVTESEVLYDFLVALGEHPDSIPDRLDARRARYRALTAGRALIVFLDGVATAQQVRALEPGPGSSLIVVTESRPVTPADAAGTHLFALKSLDAAAARDMLAGIVGAEAVAAESVEATTIVQMCDRLPVMLSTVGSMIRRAQLRISTPLAEMVERLHDENRRRVVLPTGVVFDAYCRSLPEGTQECHRALGLTAHGGEVSIAALAAAVRQPQYEIAESMIELANAHLVEQLDRTRYAVRDLVRRHARESDDRGPGERRVDEERLLWYFDEGILAADALLAPLRPWRNSMFPELPASTVEFDDADAARDWLRGERISIRAAAEYAFDIARYDLVVRWCVLLWPFYEKEKQLTDFLALHELGADAARRLGQRAALAVLRLQVGFAYYWLYELDTAANEFTEALNEDAGPEITASALEGLGLVRLAQRQQREALDLFRRNHDLARHIGDQRRIVLAIFHRAKAEAPDPALALLEQAADGFAALSGDETENEAKVRYWRGRKLLEHGDLDAATASLASAAAVMSARRRPFDEAHIAAALGDVAVARGDHEQARAEYSRALTTYSDLGFAGLTAEMRSAVDQLP
ncbi:hypothetical protein HLB23_40600 [Nocardia uniformis]|uniref:AAA+ ATPase domain-containing protein n=1 Tax=Nocardia uniformis TaxID=53432 RepID=A0A849CH22_9NOCA|nr:hypothetical protein [Nocardia uniformis]NNH76077.1 hypothetical protein [Nocardia uniformis]